MHVGFKILLTLSVVVYSGVSWSAAENVQPRNETLSALEAMFAARSSELKAAQENWYAQPGRTREDNRKDALPRRDDELQWLLGKAKEAQEQQPIDWPMLWFVARNLWWDAVTPETIVLAKAIVRLELPSNPVNDRGANPATTIEWALRTLAKSSTDEDLDILFECAIAPITGASRTFVRGTNSSEEDWTRSWLFTTACDNVLALTEHTKVLPFMERVAEAFPADAPQARVIQSRLQKAELIAAGKPVMPDAEPVVAK